MYDLLYDRQEDHLLPLLNLTTLRSLLIYGNPFIHAGKTSKDFAQV